MQWPAMMVGLKVAADTTITVEERGDLLRWGDASRFGILKTDGEPFGNLFLARKGRIVATLVIAGVYFEDTAVQELIMPRLAKLDSYKH